MCDRHVRRTDRHKDTGTAYTRHNIAWVMLDDAVYCTQYKYHAWYERQLSIFVLCDGGLLSGTNSQVSKS